MSIRDNFRQALNEFSGGGKEAETVPAAKTLPSYDYAAARNSDLENRSASETMTDNAVKAPTSARSVYDSSASSGAETVGKSPTAQTNPNKAANQTNQQGFADLSGVETPAGKRTAVITEDTQIHGAIVTKSPLQIYGKVKGNILCEEAVLLVGEIEGNVTAMSIELQGATVNGNLRMKNEAILQKGSKLTGSLEAENAVLNGSVKGDLRVRSNIKILEESQISGDIYSSSLEIAKGAFINGKVAVIKDGQVPTAPAEDAKTASPAAETKGKGDGNRGAALPTAARVKDNPTKAGTGSPNTAGAAGQASANVAIKAKEEDKPK